MTLRWTGTRIHACMKVIFRHKHNTHTIIGVFPRGAPPTFQGRTKNIFVINYTYKGNELTQIYLFQLFEMISILFINKKYQQKFVAL